MNNEHIPDFVSVMIDVCMKPHHTTPKLKQLSLNMFEIDFTNTNIGIETVLSILNLLYISKNFKNLELVVSTEQGLFTYTPKKDDTPSVLNKLGCGVNTSFSIYIYN